MFSGVWGGRGGHTENIPLNWHRTYQEVEADGGEPVVVDEGEDEGDAEEDHHVNIIEERVESVPSLLTEWTVKPHIEGVQEDSYYLQTYQNWHVQIPPPTPAKKIFQHFSRFYNQRNIDV